MTFRAKIILVLIIAATFPVSVAGFVSISTYEREMTDRINNFHNKSAALAASGISDFLSDTLQSLKLTSRIIPFEQFPMSDLPDALKIPYRQFHFINIVALFDQNGRQLSTPAFEAKPSTLTGLEGHESVFYGDVQRFVEAIPFAEALDKGAAFGDAYYNSRTETPRVALAIAFPVAQGKRQWILSAEISLKSILTKIRDITPSARGTAFIVDRSGRVVCHSNKILMARRSSLGDLDIVRYGQRSKKGGTRLYRDLDAMEMAGAFAPITLTSWGLVVAQPVEEAFEVVKKVKAVTLFWVVLSLVVAILGGVLLAKGVAAPVRELAKGAERIASRDFNWQISINTADEIGQLAKTFNHMSFELKRSFDTITEKNEEIAKWNEELQGRVMDRTRELRQAEEQIIRSQKMAVVAELTAGIAHEINNPLTSIMGFSQFMLTQITKDHKYAKYLTSIVEGAKRIQILVDDMLRFGRSGDNPTFANVDLNQLLENTIAMVSRQLKERGIDARTYLAPNLPLASGDPAQLQQVFVHILNNAKTAMPEGGLLNVGTEEVEGGAIKVLIEDSGVGIPEENLSKIFDLFYTTKDEWSKKGFGLSVADRIVRDHKGKISVSSKVGVGSKFTIFLPGVQKTTHLG